MSLEGGWLCSSASVRAGAPWLIAGANQGDVVISSRVRLARNLTEFAFISRCDTDTRAQVLTRIQRHVPVAKLAEQIAWCDLHATSALERQLLVERHLISKEHAKGEQPRAVIVSVPDERLSIMVNEEDHLRIQVLRPGLALDEAMGAIDEADDRLEAGLDFAFSPRFGYLTACPTNVGTAVRFSVMLHLPGLRLTGEIDKAKRAARDMCLAVRGFYGEGSEALGDLYQVSNQTTLGRPESALLKELQHDILPQVLEFERQARKTMLDKRRRTLEDQVFRSLGLLRHARLLTPEEALTHLSLVRLGILLGLIADIELASVNQLLVQCQPAHLQRLAGRELDQQQRREARSDLVRQVLKGS
jgi:protein arginine kinase